MGLEEQLEFDFVEDIDFRARHSLQYEYMNALRGHLELASGKIYANNKFLFLYVEAGYAKRFADSWKAGDVKAIKTEIITWKRNGMNQKQYGRTYCS